MDVCMVYFSPRLGFVCFKVSLALPTQNNNELPVKMKTGALL